MYRELVFYRSTSTPSLIIGLPHREITAQPSLLFYISIRMDTRIASKTEFHKFCFTDLNETDPVIDKVRFRALATSDIAIRLSSLENSSTET
jgi:hypothetical protein